jgi:hypothetical protein
MELYVNKKPRFKNRGLSCGPIRANGSNQVDLSFTTGISVKCCLFEMGQFILYVLTLKFFSSKLEEYLVQIYKVEKKIQCSKQSLTKNIFLIHQKFAKKSFPNPIIKLQSVDIQSF